MFKKKCNKFKKIKNTSMIEYKVSGSKLPNPFLLTYLIFPSTSKPKVRWTLDTDSSFSSGSTIKLCPILKTLIAYGISWAFRLMYLGGSVKSISIWPSSSDLIDISGSFALLMANLTANATASYKFPKHSSN